MNTRQKEILQIAEKEGEVAIKELAGRLAVSEMTIHRDADYLQEQRYLYKKRGAIVFVENGDRSGTDFYTDEKRAIGVRAAMLIEEEQSVVFDNSTTALECAKFLDHKKKYIFYTTGMETASVLADYDKSILYCSGGYYFPASKGFVGTQAESFVSSLKADVCIIGASGVSLDGGITTPYPMHTALQKAIVSCARTKILVCDHSKFNRIAMEKICCIGDMDIIVTDSGLSDEIYEQYSKHVKIIKA